MRCIIAGGRDFYQRDFMYGRLNAILATNPTLDITILSGNAPGADTLGKEWAHETGYKCELFPAKWTEEGKAAGPLRNSRMITEGKATHLIAFWNGRSTGTKDMIDKAITAGLWVKVVRY